MEHLKMHTPNQADENFRKLAELFPNAVTETIIGYDEDGKAIVDRAIDKDILMQEISAHVVEGREERYQFTWPDKKKTMLSANAPISATLRPIRNESIGRDGALGGWDSENLYVEGDNLDVLKLLRETYLGKIKLIYIDPPYNTGNDFVYEDHFAEDTTEYMARSGQYDEQGNRLEQNMNSKGRYHTDWINMMFARLRACKSLLRDDGVIFASIDENEVNNLRKLMDEVFGEANFAGEIIWKNSSKNDQAYISIQHEYILCYVRNKVYNSGNWTETKEGTDEIFAAFDGFKKQYGNDWQAIHKAALDWYKQFPESNPIYSSKHYSWMDERGVYFPDNISGPHFGQYRYDVIHPITGKPCKEPASGWRFSQTTMQEKIQQGLIHFGPDETTVPNNKTYLANTLKQSLTSIKYKDGRVASKQLTALMEGNYFTNPKDVNMLITLFTSIGLEKSDIILDFFSGSASTAEAVMKISATHHLPLRFIMVQIQEDLDKSLSKAIGSAKQVLADAIALCDRLQRPHYLTQHPRDLGRKPIIHAQQ